MLWLYTQSPHKVSIDYTLLKLSVHQMFAQSLQDSESQLHVSNMWFSRKPSKITESCKKVQLGAQFCLIYLLLFSTCFGHPFAPHQEKITVSMRHSCLSLRVGGVWSANRPDATHTEWQIPVSHGYSNFLLMMGTWMPETRGEEK